MIKVLFDLFTSFCQTKITIEVPDKKMTYGSDKAAQLMPEYDFCHGFLNMLDISKGLAPGDPVRMAQRIIESVEIEPTPLRMVLGSQVLAATLG